MSPANHSDSTNWRFLEKLNGYFRSLVSGSFSKWWWLVLLLAAILRFYQLGQIPVSLYWDEAAMLADAKYLASEGRDTHGGGWGQAIFPSYGDYKMPVYIWLASASVKLFGVSAWSFRLPNALASLGTIIIASWLVKELIDGDRSQINRRSLSNGEFNSNQIAVAVALVLTFNPWSMMFGRTGFEAHL